MRLLLLLAAILPLALRAQTTASVTLTWNANAEPDIAGYTVYRSTVDGTWDWSANVGNVTQAAVSGLLPGQRYAFSVTARNRAGFESEKATPVLYTVPGGKPSAPPTEVLAERSGTQLLVRWNPEPEDAHVIRYWVSWITLGGTNWVKLPVTEPRVEITVPERDYLMVRVSAETPGGIGPEAELVVPGFPKAPSKLAVTPNSIRWTIPQ